MSQHFIKYLQQNFGVNDDEFLKALEMSPGAQGSIHGSIGELLFMKYAIDNGYDVSRIKEKPDGSYDSKTFEARGDFYVRKKNWPNGYGLVIENKGVKTNHEKRANYTNKKTLVNFLHKHAFQRSKKVESIYNKGLESYEKVKKRWETNNNTEFPKFRWNKFNPGPGIPDLTNIWENEESFYNWINSFNEKDLTENKFWDLEAPCRVIGTHMPNSRIDPVTGIKSTGPLVGEFSILAVDLFLRTGKHEFVFANSFDLNHQRSSPNHLQQNYTIDVLVNYDGFKRHKLLHPWHEDLDDCITSSKPELRKIDKSQLDLR